MAYSIVVREYAKLTTAKVKNTLDRAHIPQSCFDWLLNKQASFSESGKKLLELTNLSVLKLGSHVGFLQSPYGTSIEILPKHFKKSASLHELQQSRETLLKMIAVSLQLPVRQYDAAQLQLLEYPLPEWVYAQFLKELDKLYQKGLRFQYQQVEEESRFLRGQLDVGKQLRQPPGRGHLFQIRHEIFTPDRPENRLIKLALDIAREAVKEPENWRLCNELSHLLSPIPTSLDSVNDFRAWKDDRLMHSYRNIRPWCELIIRRLNPTSQKGLHKGISLLFPMEKLFEHYVAYCLNEQLSSSWRLKIQPASKYLCTHAPAETGKTKSVFQLKPDLLLYCGDKKHVLDTKWKLIDGRKHKDNYDIGQPDFYQMFAYGQQYMGGTGDMMLIYPATDRFSSPLPVFDFGHGLRLWVVPFDLVNSKLIGGIEQMNLDQ